ncbi:uncharacterized membrane protein HdeD (DUF308 family) [Sagittula marina]|uniref:Uncharacterized membrane protein HdeD (DUF308 family) n=1 Tax=Sagittula marina TaxID=943940 RepID=A0A7W6DLZ3_9RHOB|nr:HdeD family acid-resistance protein [Sagittula marina]MBB3983876.1 uncharacterized membrane protein HdeD (DUF308 family) [Sagittula marina]
MTSRTFFVISGIVLIVGGILALLLPFAASVTVALIVGWSFLFAGAVHIVGAFRDRDSRLWSGIFGLLEVALGLSFILNPLTGLVSLTVLLGVLFFVSGAMQLYLAFARRTADSTWMLALSGAVSVALALLIAFNLLSASATVPGVLLGIELISTGVAFLMLRPRRLAQLREDLDKDHSHA